MKAISDEIKNELGRLSVNQKGIEGYPEAKWILMDFGNIIVHLFGKETRSYYDLELLWGDAPRVSW